MLFVVPLKVFSLLLERLVLIEFDPESDESKDAVSEVLRFNEPDPIEAETVSVVVSEMDCEIET